MDARSGAVVDVPIDVLNVNMGHEAVLESERGKVERSKDESNRRSGNGGNRRSSHS